MAMESGTGMRITCDGNRTLTIRQSDLLVFDPALKEKSRNSCGLLWPGNTGERLLKLYNILWAEFRHDRLTIQCAVRTSKTKLTVENLEFAISPESIDNKEPLPDIFAATLQARAYAEAQPQKRAYVLINPHAGPGKAVAKWQEEVKPLFDAARLSADVVTLSRGGEAQELVEKVNLDSYDTIVACSGDGTPFEIFNGLARRSDAARALERLAVSQIPCGSGNAMACNLYGSGNAGDAALGIIKGVAVPLDLTSITQDGTRVLSFLSQAVGIIAESDLGTEHLRWMGSARFDWGVLTRIFHKKCYPFDLAVKIEVEGKDNIKAHYKRFADGLSKLDQSSELSDTIARDGLPKLKYGTVSDELHEGWELVRHDKVGNFYCGKMALVSPRVHFFTAALPSDGCIDLITMNGDMPTITALSTMTAVESPKFFDMPEVHYRKISAYRIIPRDQEDGYISIDGESIPFAPFQAELHPGLGRVIAKSALYDVEGPYGWQQASSA